MFQSARLKLTGIYLIIIMVISIVFSISFYRVATIEFEQGLARITHRIRVSPRMYDVPPQVFEIAEELTHAKHIVALRLVYLNGIIFVVAGLSGYFLAGKTLSPIERALAEQKRFVSDASHELRTPIAALTTTVEVALRDKKASKASQSVYKDLLDRLRHLTTLTNHLLTLARTESYNEAHREAVYIHEILKKSIKTLAPLAKEKSVQIVYKSSSSPIVVSGRPDDLRELFTIVLSNAIAYSMKKDTVSISLQKKRSTVVVTITDTGTGIAKKDLPYIFDRFYRADTARSGSTHQGFGLGLSVARRIVSEHAGVISAKSTKGKGTTISISLPLSYPSLSDRT